MDNKIDRAHVDAEFQARRSHDRRELPGLQRFLDLRSFRAGDRAVVSSRDNGLRDVVGIGARELGPLGGALGGQLVEAGAEPLGEPP